MGMLSGTSFCFVKLILASIFWQKKLPTWQEISICLLLSQQQPNQMVFPGLQVQLFQQQKVAGLIFALSTNRGSQLYGCSFLWNKSWCCCKVAGRCWNWSWEDSVHSSYFHVSTSNKLKTFSAVSVLWGYKMTTQKGHMIKLQKVIFYCEEKDIKCQSLYLIYGYTAYIYTYNSEKYYNVWKHFWVAREKFLCILLRKFV